MKEHLVKLALTQIEVEVLAVAVGLANDDQEMTGDVWEREFVEPAKKLEKKLTRLWAEEK